MSVMIISKRHFKIDQDDNLITILKELRNDAKKQKSPQGPRQGFQQKSKKRANPKQGF